MDIAFIIPAVSMYRRDVSILILSADTIRMSADIFIAFENILIVFPILVRKTAKRRVFIVREKNVFFGRKYL